MHDGRIQTLREVINHYQKGGESHVNKSKVIQAFKLNEKDVEDLISFLNTLTDSEFIQNKKHGNPFRH
jgi:cytochrome c peroxidase